MVIFLFAIQIIGNLVSKESEGILTVSLTALGMGIAVKAGKYIFHKKPFSTLRIKYSEINFFAVIKQGKIRQKYY